MIKRTLDISSYVKPGKTLIVTGPRRVGKTTLVNEFLATQKGRIKTFDGESAEAKNVFSDNSLAKIEPNVVGSDILFIDEAQEIANIGRSLKLINDHFSDIAVIVSGSSSFELNNQIGEPLVGRSTTKFLYPFSILEVFGNDYPDWQQQKDNLLVYGMYPDSVMAKNNDDRKEYLRELVNKLLLKDILTFQEVKGSQALLQLLALLAFQIGKEVSIEELGTQLGMGKNTVYRYLDLLEKAYVVFRVGGFSRNLRKEITKKPRYYFYDVGIRNAIINNFNAVDLRDDLGQLWENFAIVERMKIREYKRIFANQYFWRTYSQNEIDLVEERDGKLFAYEMKYTRKKAEKTKVPTEWAREYAGEYEFSVIHPENLMDWLLGSESSNSSKLGN